MKEALKQTLMQYAWMMAGDFTNLQRGIHQPSDLQISDLEILAMSIGKLQCTLQQLPISDSALSLWMQQDIRNQLTVIAGFAQMLVHKEAKQLEEDAHCSLDKILSANKHLEAALQTHKVIIPVYSVGTDKPLL